MKKFYTLGLAIFTLTTAQAQTESKNLVTLTGTLDPAFTIEMSTAETEAFVKGIEGINNMPSITVDINSVYDKQKDQPAFEAASKEVRRVFLEAAKKIVDMRAIVYKLDIALQQDPDHRFTDSIYKAYNKKFQSSFTSLLQLFLGVDEKFNPVLTNAMESCFTTSCLQDIASAQLDLVDFGRSINNRIDLHSSKRWENSQQQFKSRLVKDAARITVDEVLKTNTKESKYVEALRAAAAPFAAAAAGFGQVFENIGEFIHSKKLGRYLLAANPIDRDSREWDKFEEKFSNQMGENYEKIVADQKGAKQYKEPIVEVKQISAAATGSNETPIHNPYIDASFSAELKRLDEQFQNLNKLNALNEAAAHQMIVDAAGATPSAGFVKYLQAVSENILAQALRSGLVHERRERSFEMTAPFSFLSDVKIDGGLIRTKTAWCLSDYARLSFAGSGTFVVDFVTKGDDSVRVIFLKSYSADVWFALMIADNYQNYLTKDNLGNWRVNLNPKAPTVKLILLK